MIWMVALISYGCSVQAVVAAFNLDRCTGAMALAVSTRLWLGAVCSPQRDRHLARQIMTCVYNWAQHLPLVIAFDGWNAYAKAVLKVFRELFFSGKRRAPRLMARSCLTVGYVLKSSRLVSSSFSRQVVSGSATMLRYLLNLTQPLHTSLNKAYIERLNATFSSHVAIFARRTRYLTRLQPNLHAHVFLLGCVYNFCSPHAALQHQPWLWRLI